MMTKCWYLVPWSLAKYRDLEEFVCIRALIHARDVVIHACHVIVMYRLAA